MRRILYRLASFNLIATAATVSNNLIIVWFFGVNRSLEIYLASQVLYQTILKITQVGVFNEVAVPLLNKTKYSSGKEDAEQAAFVLINWVLIIVVCMIIVTISARHFLFTLIVPGFTLEERKHVESLYVAISFLPCITILTSYYRSLLSACSKFGRGEISNVIAGTLNLIGNVLLIPKYQVMGLIYSIWFASTVQLIFLYLQLRWNGMHHRFELFSKLLSMRSLTAQIGSSSFYTIATQVYSVVISASLSLLAPGFYAIYRYVEKIGSLQSSLLFQPIVTVFYTVFSANAAINNQNTIKVHIKKAIEYIVFLVPLLLLLCIVTFPGLKDLLYHKNRQLHLFAFSLGITLVAGFMFDAPRIIYSKLLYAYSMIPQVFAANAIVQIFSAAAVFILTHWLSFWGFLIARFLNPIFMLALIMAMVVHNYKSLYVSIPWMTLSKVALVTITISLFIWIIPHTIWIIDTKHIMRNVPFLFGIAGIIISYFALCWIFRVRLINFNILKRGSSV